MLFIFVMTCLQIVTLVASDENNRSLAHSQDSALLQTLQEGNLRIRDIGELGSALESIIARSQAGLLGTNGNIKITIVDNEGILAEAATAAQAASLVASDENNRSLTDSQGYTFGRPLKNNGIKVTGASELEREIETIMARGQANFLVPKGDVNFTAADHEGIPAAAAAAQTVSLVALPKKEYPWVSPFHRQREAFIEQKYPQFMPYFDKEILDLLAYNFDVALVPDEFKETYLWGMFLDVSREVFKQVYENVTKILEIRRLDGTVPFNFQIEEHDVYKKIVIQVLQGCLNLKLLEYEKNRDRLTFSMWSKQLLKNKIVGSINALVQVKIHEHYKTYRPYCSDKAPVWVADYMKQTLKIITTRDKAFIAPLYLPDIIHRIAYDIHEILTRALTSEEQKDFDRFKELEEKQQKKCVTFFYLVFYEGILQEFYTSFNSYKKEHSVDIKDEEVLSLVSTAFEYYPFNIFHVNPVGDLKITTPFIDFFIRNITDNVNLVVKRKQCKEDGRDKSIPPFLLQSKVRNEESSFDMKKARKQEAQELSSEAYRLQQALAVTKSQEHEQQRQARQKQLDLAAANKAKKEEEERERQEQLAKKEAERKQRELEKQAAANQAGQQLQEEKDKLLNNLYEKGKLLYDLEENAQGLQASDIINLIRKIRAAIDEQRGLFNKSKNLKKTLTESRANCGKIDTDIQAIQEALEKKAMQKNAHVANEADTQSQSPVEEKNIASIDNSADNLPAAAALSSAPVLRLIKRYTHNPYRMPSIVPVSLAQQASDDSATKNESQPLVEPANNRLIPALFKAFYPEQYDHSKK